ncbi:MAG: toll/interleukin-1 receptor domain-containing protein [Oscillibacter sp.]|nr:toll/interleukin-1 receptor domain-containing protein [Oscillibacter sp.]
MADVFISYHRSIDGIVDQIAAELESVGISCWYAGRDLPVGADFASFIPREIKNCKVFLLVINKESAQSQHVLNEVALAFRRMMTRKSMAVVPFKVDDCALPDSLGYYLANFHIIKGNPPDSQHIQLLIERITSKLPETRQSPLVAKYLSILDIFVSYFASRKQKVAFVSPQQKIIDELNLKISLLEAQVKQLQGEKKQKGSSLDVFVSYHVSNNSTPFVRKFVNILESAGIFCWYAPRDVKPGEWVDSILNALDKCKIFLLLLDEGANNSGFVYIETVLARTYYNESKNAHPLLLPFQIGELQTLPRLHSQLRPFQIFNGGESFETADTTELISKITHALGKL